MRDFKQIPETFLFLKLFYQDLLCDSHTSLGVRTEECKPASPPAALRDILLSQEFIRLYLKRWVTLSPGKQPGAEKLLRSQNLTEPGCE